MKAMTDPEKLTAAEFARYFDHTFLKAAGEPDAVRKLCREAKRYGFASVCVNPCEVLHAAKLLEGSGVKVCTVIGFPLGQNTEMMKFIEATSAVGHGADELDFVVNVRRLKEAARGVKTALKELRAELCACVAAAGRPFSADRGDGARIVTKLIIECCYLTDDEKRFACGIAKEVGFDFVKTSTGFGTGGATEADVRLMRDAVGPVMGVKAAGGIRTLADAFAMIRAGATRLGSSASVSIMKEFKSAAG